MSAKPFDLLSLKETSGNIATMAKPLRFDGGCEWKLVFEESDIGETAYTRSCDDAFRSLTDCSTSKKVGLL